MSDHPPPPDTGFDRGCLVATWAGPGDVPRLRQMMASVRERWSRDVPFGIVDLGLPDEERGRLREAGASLVAPRHGFDLGGIRDVPARIHGSLCRAALDRIFPGPEVYLWLDTDAWIQDRSAPDLLVRGARSRGLAIVPEVDRGYSVLYGGMPGLWSEQHAAWSRLFGTEVADRLSDHPMLDTGAFAITSGSVWWTAWRHSLEATLRQGVSNLTDRLSLAHALYTGDRQLLYTGVHLLPAWCHWACRLGVPAWDEAQGRLVEPAYPRAAIGIVCPMRSQRNGVELPTAAGGRIRLSLAYPPAVVA